MTLRQIVIFETLPTEKVLTEDKVSAFVKNVLDRYENPLRAPRIEAAIKLSKRNPKDSALALDNGAKMFYLAISSFCYICF